MIVKTNNKPLIYLDLSGVKSNIEAIELLSNLLKKNKTLLILNLGNNYIRDKGIDYLSEALKENKTLTQLNLAGNEKISTTKKIEQIVDCNKEWNVGMHLSQTSVEFQDAVFYFLCSIKVLLKQKTVIKPPKPVQLMIISKIDRKSFL